MSCQDTVFPSAWVSIRGISFIRRCPHWTELLWQVTPVTPNCETQQSCFSFTLPDILCHRLLVTFFFPCGEIQSIFRLPPCSSWFFNRSIKFILSFFLSVIKKCVCLYGCPFVISSILHIFLYLTSIGRWQFSWVPLLFVTAADYWPPDCLP